MNDAVYKFKRYEDSSIIYTGLNKHEGEYIGGWDTVLTPQDYKAITGTPSLFVNEPLVNT